MLSRSIVDVLGSDTDLGAASVLRAIADTFGFEIAASGTSPERIAGTIVLPGAQANDETTRRHDVPTLRLVAGERLLNATIQFDANLAPWPFRERTLTANSGCTRALDSVGVETIARVNGFPVWTSDRRASVRHDCACVPPDWIQPDDCAFQHLSGKTFMDLLPVVEWFRHLSDWDAWTQPPLQACFMFDDPNLHFAHYGFLDFQELAAAAARDGYHVAFATIPLDSYHVSPRAARILRDARTRLSLLVHGNNHTYRELAGTDRYEDRIAAMEQALLRTCRLAETSGVEVSAVMAPPHGVCSATSMAAMARAGFEGVCVSHGSVATGNPSAPWRKSLGLMPVINVDGLPVIPRFGLSSDAANDAVIAAYLRQPIVIVGHHWDVASGLDVLSRLAAEINQLGTIRWDNMSKIARAQFRQRIEGTRLHVQSWARKCIIQVPPDVTEIRYTLQSSERARFQSRRRSGDVLHPLSFTPLSDGILVAVTPSSTVEIEAAPPSTDRIDRTLPRTPFSAIARRVLTECRDRTMPYLPHRFTQHA